MTPSDGTIATRRGYCWVVTLVSPEEQTYYGRTLEEGLAWCLVFLMAGDMGIGQFAI